MANENDKNHLYDAILARVAKKMNEPRLAASVRETLETSAAATRRFRFDEGVYNRNTKEDGMVRQVYEKDGVTMYRVWLPATTDPLRGGHFVSDWAEGVLEPSEKVVSESAPLPTEVGKIRPFRIS
jgi:hypothetical protein